ncbi:MAG TPA: N,N-dimethylformamidase beta subunit family domain-containing protein [Polyangiaceae bacterium]|nr:N,N-dimethylformamidase beta subunit family domain-containing protein [Polyangiaceae bacterium]
MMVRWQSARALGQAVCATLVVATASGCGGPKHRPIDTTPPTDTGQGGTGQGGGVDQSGTGQAGVTEPSNGGAAVAASTGGDGGQADAADSAPTRIQLENALPGTTAFELQAPATDGEVEGYFSAVSAVAGDTVDVHVNVSVSSSVNWQLFRLGYYQGLGARLVAHGEGLELDPQPACPPSKATGLIECRWATAFSIKIDPSWVSGYYLVKFTREDGFDATAPLIVREATPFAPLLVQASVNTWQAYNRWGGTSLYHDAEQVSYDRPYGELDEPGSLFAHETYLYTWLEKHGVEVAYTTDVDIDRDPSVLDSIRLFVVSGHDEYWSLPQRHAMDHARDNGLSLAILSANTGYWRVRLEASSSGVERRIVTCYKSTKDPVKNSPDTTVRYRDDPDPQPENELTGSLYQLGDYPNAGQLPMYVADPVHWLFEDTGALAGERLAVALGGEWDEPADDANEPSGVHYVLGSTGIDQTGHVMQAAAALYEPTAQSFVFAAGTEEFAHALSEPHTVNARAERMLDNVLARAGVRDPNPTPPVPPTPKRIVPGQVVVLAGTGEPGYKDGPGNEARFDSPAGLAVGPDGTLYVTEARNHDVRAIAPDGAVTTFAGHGPHGTRTGEYKNGPVADAEFDAPDGIAVNADGVVFVADTGNNRIRAISGGTVSTFAGGSAGSTDGHGSHAQFAVPSGLTLGTDGSLYVVEPKNASLRRIDPSGNVTTLTTGAAEVDAVAVASDGGIYMASPHTGKISEWTPKGLRDVTDSDSAPGERIAGGDVHSLLDAWMRPSSGLAFDGHKLVLSDMCNDAIRQIVFDTDPAQASLETLLPETSPADTLPNGQPAGLMLPRGIVPYGGGYAVADSGHHRIVIVKSASDVH